MATPSPAPQPPAAPSPAPQPSAVPSPATNSSRPPPQATQIPAAPAIKSECPAADSREILPSAASSLLPEPSPAASYTITIPSYSGWFSWDEIHETERRLLREFFDGRSASRNPRVYRYFRDSIIGRFRANPSRKITFTEARRGLVGDVGSIRRVFDFLEEWGLINYTPSAKPTSKERREIDKGSEKKESPKKLCSSCKSVCSLACFATDKADIALCARCFVRGNYRPGLSSTDFKRVDITEETKTDWTDKETLHLLEAVLQYGDDWKRVAEHVGGRSEKDCVARFIKLPFGEQFLGPLEVTDDGREYQTNDQISAESEGETVAESFPSKRRRLTPLADASNPIMAQVAFLSAMVDSDVAKASAQAAIAALYEAGSTGLNSTDDTNIGSIGNEMNGAFAADGQPAQVLREVIAEAQSQLEKEQQDVEQSLSDVVEIQMEDIQNKIIRFEELELQMEKEWTQLRYIKDLLFADQSAVLQHKARLTSKGGEEWDKFRSSNDVT